MKKLILGLLVLVSTSAFSLENEDTDVAADLTTREIMAMNIAIGILSNEDAILNYRHFYSNDHEIPKLYSHMSYCMADVMLKNGGEAESCISPL